MKQPEGVGKGVRCALVMPGLVQPCARHPRPFLHRRARTWMAPTSPAMTATGLLDADPIPKTDVSFEETISMISLTKLQRRIDAGDLSPDAAIAQSLEAIEVREKAVGAFVCRVQ